MKFVLNHRELTEAVLAWLTTRGHVPDELHLQSVRLGVITKDGVSLHELEVELVPKPSR